MTTVWRKWQQLEMQLYCKTAFGVTDVDGGNCPLTASSSDSQSLPVADVFPFGDWV